MCARLSVPVLVRVLVFLAVAVWVGLMPVFRVPVRARVVDSRRAVAYAKLRGVGGRL